MYKDLYNQEYDYVIFGTSLTESTLSAYLSKLGKKIMQIDVAKVYGGDCKNFNLKDMEKFISELKEKKNKDSCLNSYKLVNKETKIEEPLINNEKFREYNFDMNPKLVYAKSKATRELTDSNASNYIEFSSVKKIFYLFNNKLLNVPFSKSQIFMSNDIELLEKQKLLNFLFAIMKIKNTDVDVNSTVDIKKDYDLDNNTLLEEIKKNLNVNAEEFLSKRFTTKVKEMLLYILANKSAVQTLLTVDEMCDKIYKFLLSIQIYDDTPFLYPIYGSSEYSQAMCRLCAVYGGIYLVNECFKAKIYYNTEALLNKEAKIFAIEVEDTDNKETFVVMTNNIIMNTCYLDDDKSAIQINNDVPVKKMIDSYMYKYTGFFIIKCATELLPKKGSPYYYRVSKNDEEFKNQYEFSVLEFCEREVSVPRHRIMYEIIVFSNKEEEDEDNFKNICMAISQQFINMRVIEIEKAIKEKYSTIKIDELMEMKRLEIINCEKKEGYEELVKKEEEEKIEQEKKDKEAGKRQWSEPLRREKVSLSPEVILQYEFTQKINFNDYQYDPEQSKTDSEIIFTKNDYVDVDLDTYFDESERIVKQENFVPLPQSEEQARKESMDDNDSDDQIIDELFDQITLDNKEEDLTPKIEIKQNENKTVEEKKKEANQISSNNDKKE